MSEWLRRRFMNAPAETFLTIHRVTAYSQVVLPLLVAAIFSRASDFGHTVSAGLMEAMTQIIVLLFLAQLADEAFLARRIVDKSGVTDLGRRYVAINAQASFLQLVVGEAAALYGSTAHPTTFVVVLALGIALMQALDLSLGSGLKGGLRPVAFVRFLEVTGGAGEANPGTSPPTTGCLGDVVAHPVGPAPLLSMQSG